MRTRMIVLLAVVAAAALAVHGMYGGATQAQVTLGSGLSVTVRAAQTNARPGADLALQVEVANTGAVPLVVTLGCEPPYDFQVFDAVGNLVWRLHPACDSTVRVDVTLMPGDRRTWNGAWAVVDGAGRPVSGGRYFVYGLVLTVPRAAVAGPLPIDVAGPTATQGPIVTPPTHTPTPDTKPPTATPVPSESPTPVTPEPSPEPPTSLPPFPVAESPNRQTHPDVAGGLDPTGCQHLVVWWDEGLQQVYGRFANPDGPGEPFAVSDKADAVGPAKVAMNEGTQSWLVVWPAPAPSGAAKIRGRALLCGGPAGDAFDVSQGPLVADQPAVAADGDTFAVVWRQATNTGQRQVFGLRLPATVSAQPSAVSSAGVVADPAIACDGTGPCLVAWTQQQATADALDVLGRMWSPRDRRLGSTTMSIGATAGNERYASVAWNGASQWPTYMVTWTSEGGAHPAVKVRPVFAQPAGPIDAYAPGPTTAEVGLNGLFADWADIAPEGPDFAVAWATGPAGADEIMAARVRFHTATRDPLVTTGVVVSDRRELEAYPAIAASRDPMSLVVWQLEADGGDADVWGRYTAVVGPALSRVVLVGRLTHTGLMVQSDATWTVRVSKVLAGSFLCGDAVVHVSDPSLADPGLQPGDEVSVSGDPVPSEGDCVLAVGANGTFLRRSRLGSAMLPYVLKQ